MNYTVQKRIKEIIELLNQIINDLEVNLRKFDLGKPNAEKRRKTYQSAYKFLDSQLEWENIVLEKSLQLKDSIENIYKLELKELEEKEAIIRKGLDKWNPQFDGIRKYFFDEYFLLTFFRRYPEELLQFGQIIIVAESINWRSTYLKLANTLIETSNCDIEAFEYFQNHMNSSKRMERENVTFLFDSEYLNKNELEEKMKTTYDRFLKIDSYIIEGGNLNNKTDLANDLELVLSSLINFNHSYNNIPDEYISNELVYLFAAFNSSSNFKNAHEDIRSNEAIVNFILNIEILKSNHTFNSEERIVVKKQHARNIYPYASKEIRANEFIANMAAI